MLCLVETNFLLDPELHGEFVSGGYVVQPVGTIFLEPRLPIEIARQSITVAQVIAFLVDAGEYLPIDILFYRYFDCFRVGMVVRVRNLLSRL